MSFKTGDKVICIDKSDINSLTLGKTYTIFSVDIGGVTVIDDVNQIVGYFAWRFKPVIKMNREDLL